MELAKLLQMINPTQMIQQCRLRPAVMQSELQPVGI